MKTITLKANGVGRYDDVSPFIIADRALTLNFKLSHVNGEFYLITENNGKKEKFSLSAGVPLNINGISAGEFRAEVKHYLKGELIKTYIIEPLLLKEVDGNLSAEPEITAMWREMDRLKEIAVQQEKAAEREKELNSEISECRVQIRHLQANMVALMRFAFTDYRQNVYLDGGDLNKFAVQFGFELNEEEIKLLEEGNDED